MRIVVLVGLPGSGKSTWLECRQVTGLSSDTIRGWLADDETDQTIHDRVFETLWYLLRQRLALGREVTYIDATNLNPQMRAAYIGIGRSWGCDVEAVFFDVPLEVCRERNSRRRRVVPEEALARLAGKLVPPTLAEGFSRVVVVRPALP
ncbi:MAG: AAA family ATPase [Opitutales bacterium]